MGDNNLEFNFYEVIFDILNYNPIFDKIIERSNIDTNKNDLIPTLVKICKIKSLSGNILEYFGKKVIDIIITWALFKSNLLPQA